MGIGRKQAKALKDQEYREERKKREEENRRRAEAERKRRDKNKENIKMPMAHLLVVCENCLVKDRWDSGPCYRCGDQKLVLDVIKAIDEIDDDIWITVDNAIDSHGYRRFGAINSQDYLRLHPEVIMALSIQEMRNSMKKIDEIHAMLHIVKDYLRPVRDFGARATVNAIDKLLDKEI